LEQARNRINRVTIVVPVGVSASLPSPNNERSVVNFVEIAVALLPLRRGEGWAFWVAGLPLASLVVPLMLVDAVNVAPEHRLTTLTPFIVGLVLTAIGLFLAKRRARSQMFHKRVVVTV